MPAKTGELIASLNTKAQQQEQALVANTSTVQRIILWCFFALVAVLISGCGQQQQPSVLTSGDVESIKQPIAHPISLPPKPPLKQEVYLWQRQWRLDNQAALIDSQADFQGLRILALQAHPQKTGADTWFEVAVNHQWLQTDPRPKIAVVRLDGQLARLNSTEALDHIERMLKHWRAQGTEISGIEIDHDSGSSKLLAYANFLQQLRAKLAASAPLNHLKLSITALPAWMTSPNFHALFPAIDELVLQIHSVSDPRNGLFDAEQGWRWLETLAQLSPVPYLVALPSYGSMVISTPQGFEVESETPTRYQLNQHSHAQELMADPHVLQQFVAQLQQKHQDTTWHHFTGIVWFRLPLTGDKRIWPLKTLRAVAHQGQLKADIQVQISQTAPHAINNLSTQASESPRRSLFQISLINLGNVAGDVPMQLSLAGQACSGYDAQNGYRVKSNKQINDKAIDDQQSQQFLIWQRNNTTTQDRQLNPNARRVIGWARCHILK